MKKNRVLLPALIIATAVGLLGCSAQNSATSGASASSSSPASTAAGPSSDSGPCPTGFLAAKQAELRKDLQPKALVTPITYTDLVGSPQPATSPLANACFYVTTNTAFIFQTAVVKGGDAATVDQIGKELTSLGFEFTGTSPTSHANKYTGAARNIAVALITDRTLADSPEGQAFGIPYVVVVRQIIN